MVRIRSFAFGTIVSGGGGLQLYSTFLPGSRSETSYRFATVGNSYAPPQALNREPSPFDRGK